MKYVFMFIIMLTLFMGVEYVKASDADQAIVRQNVLEIYAQVVEYTQENPKQLTGYGLMAFISSVIWLSLMRIIKSSDASIEALKTSLVVTDTKSEENPIIEKAKNRALYNQLMQDRIVLIGREKWLPEEINKARRELKDAEIQEESIKNNLAVAERRVMKADENLEKLLAESDKQIREIVCIDKEISRLKELI